MAESESSARSPDLSWRRLTLKPPKNEIQNPKPETRNPKPETRTPKAQIVPGSACTGKNHFEFQKYLRLKPNTEVPRRNPSEMHHAPRVAFSDSAWRAEISAQAQRASAYSSSSAASVSNPVKNT
jgi:hypothetical protein